jgi:hypothetical protein
MTDLVRNAPRRPLRGESLLHSRERRAMRSAHEKREMQAALKRDGHACRVPHCPYRGKKLPIDPAHRVHRGMGGDPKGTRTERATVIALCRCCHGLYDRAELDIEPMTAAIFDGPCAFYRRNESGRMECFAVEQRIGVSAERSR